VSLCVSQCVFVSLSVCMSLCVCFSVYCVFTLSQCVSFSSEYSIPTAVFLRDTLKIVNTLREAKATIYDGKVKIDGIVRKSLHQAIGLMDVIELQNVLDIYRLVPTDGKILKPIKINESEKTKKIVRVTSKTTIENGKMQIGFHDGRSIISDTQANVGDSCLIQIPDQKILEVLKLQKDSQVLVTRGVNSGKIGKIESVEEGTFILPKRILLSIEERKIEIPSDIVIVIGKKDPIIQIK